MHIHQAQLTRLTAIAVAALFVLVGCSSAPAAPVGDAARGQALFTSAGCTGCHSTGSDQIVGPGLAGVVDGKGPYGDKLPNGEPINDTNLVAWIRVGGVGKIGQMPGNADLTDQNLLDLVAYLKTLK